MMNRGGEEWKHYNALMRDEVLKNQSPEGTWSGGAGVGGGGGGFYPTVLCTLMLEVYYRFLPSSSK
jgi:hypothetical protein